MVSETFLGMRVPNNLKKNIEVFAEEHDISMSHLIRWAIIDYIQKEQSKRPKTLIRTPS